MLSLPDLIKCSSPNRLLHLLQKDHMPERKGANRRLMTYIVLLMIGGLSVKTISSLLKKKVGKHSTALTAIVGVIALKVIHRNIVKELDIIHSSNHILKAFEERFYRIQHVSSDKEAMKKEIENFNLGDLDFSGKNWMLKKYQRQITKLLNIQ